MTNVRMSAVDTMHISGVGPDNLAPGEQFVVPSGVADDLEKRGLATRLGDEPEEKAAPAPENKMAEAPANKGLINSVGKSKKAGK